MNNDEQDKARAFRNAVERFLTSASNPGRATTVVNDNTPGSPYHDLVMAKIDVDAMLWDAPTPLTQCVGCKGFFLEWESHCPACQTENLRSAQWSPQRIAEFQARNAPPLEITSIRIPDNGNAPRG